MHIQSCPRGQPAQKAQEAQRRAGVRERAQKAQSAKAAERRPEKCGGAAQDELGEKRRSVHGPKMRGRGKIDLWTTRSDVQRFLVKVESVSVIVLSSESNSSTS